MIVSVVEVDNNCPKGLLRRFVIGMFCMKFSCRKEIFFFFKGLQLPDSSLKIGILGDSITREIKNIENYSLKNTF